jgi:hypothetical protein
MYRPTASDEVTTENDVNPKALCAGEKLKHWRPFA